MATVDFKTFVNQAEMIARSSAKFPILMRGRHGIGKSQVAYMLGKRLGLPVVERRAAQMTEGDLLGMPDKTPVKVNGEKASKFVPFEWFIRACTEPVVLFLDEVDRATLEVRQGIFELNDSRKLAGFDLHPDTVIIAAVNGGLHGDQYQVNSMDPAELDRYIVFDVEPTVEDWLEWAKENVSKVVRDFILHNPAHLDYKGAFEPKKVYPSPRSWHRFDLVAAENELLGSGKPPENAYTLLSAFCGVEAAVGFVDFVKNYKFAVKWEDIVKAGKLELTEKFEMSDHLALLDSFYQSEVFKNEQMPMEEIENLARYFKTLPMEMLVPSWIELAKLQIQNVSEDTVQECNLARFHRLIAEHITPALQAVADAQEAKEKAGN